MGKAKKSQVRKSTAKQFVKMSAIPAATLINPALGAALGLGVFAKGARKFAQSGDPVDAQGLLAPFGAPEADAPDSVDTLETEDANPET